MVMRLEMELVLIVLWIEEEMDQNLPKQVI
jgi:hypothetical protein